MVMGTISANDVILLASERMRDLNRALINATVGSVIPVLLSASSIFRSKKISCVFDRIPPMPQLRVVKM